MEVFLLLCMTLLFMCQNNAYIPPFAMKLTHAHSNFGCRMLKVGHPTIHCSPLFLSSNNPQQVTIKKTDTSDDTSTIKKKKSKKKLDLKKEIETEWHLILHDDEIHTIDEVVDLIEELCPLCPGMKAYEVTLEVHNTGAAIVCTSNKRMVKEYVACLQQAGLTVSMVPVEVNEGSGG